MSSLFTDLALPRTASREQKREAIERELKYRRSVYARRVADGRMTKNQATFQLWIMEEILKDYAP